MNETISTIIDKESLSKPRYTAENIALHIIRDCIVHQHYISRTTLQYMLTLVQTKSLVQRNEPLFGDDICVTHLGPGVPTVYHLFALWGGGRITLFSKLPAQYITPEDMQFINDVVHNFWELLPWEMYDIMQGEDTAYSITKEKFGERAIISYDILKMQDRLFQEKPKEDSEEHLNQSVKKLIRKE